MNDTSPEMEKKITERYRCMTPDRRMRLASSMFETARALVESSLPADLTRRDRRLAFARRLYAGGGGGYGGGGADCGISIRSGAGTTYDVAASGVPGAGGASRTAGTDGSVVIVIL